MKTVKYSTPALTLFLILVLIISMSSCKKYLDAKPDKRLAVPSSLSDAQALLDNYKLMNGFYPATGQESDGDSYLLNDDYNRLTITARQVYSWDKDATNYDAWNLLYQPVLYANLALETIQKVSQDGTNAATINNIKGQALFFRSFAFFYIAAYFSLPYDKNVSQDTPGIPLRLSSDVDEKISRATQAQTYDQITGDLKRAAQLLPVTSTIRSRPSKAAAYGLLAKVYLTMNDFERAGVYADSCLSIHDVLIDYNNINSSATTPFQTFNDEVLWQCSALQSAAIFSPTAKTDTILYNSYAEGDLRKSIFFTKNTDGTHSFKGSYDGSNYYDVPFIGVATDEIYLIRAECNARAGKLQEALLSLNSLLKNRFVAESFSPANLNSQDEIIARVLQERRKELTFRNIRWFDIRRLNKEGKYPVTLRRLVSGQLMELLPNSSRFTFLIPPVVVELSGIQQNTRN
ncbi:RagB/SusD family nutrient uptake outer membrane protein [Niabella sp.]|uniref:RagB/SusD family nutrient uptake outer membrane protein n=1 Tax=Niabella sp. TaxID=1962976 RepID=UPI002630F0AD|nr:RagB/SusD family nutrient uptake outer membrane protein [Niabella sp.]